MERDNTNRGAIWPNKKKEQDTHPDFTGSLNVGGVEFWVNAWKRKEGAPAKAPALSFSVKPKDVQPPAPRRADPISSGRLPHDDMDDQIPFFMEWRG